jgi:urea transporter
MQVRSSAERLKEVYSSSAILQFIDACLRGIGQVIFQNNPLSGALFLGALVWGSFLANTPHIPVGGVAALVAATATAVWLRADRGSLGAGLFGYNGILTGLALSYFLGPGIAVLAYAALGGCVTAIAMLGPVNAAKP